MPVPLMEITITMKEFDRLVEVVDILRSKDGCEWDKAQKLQDLRTYFLEEAYELVDAINENDSQKIEEELGDVCLMLVFISRMFKEKKLFTMKEVLEKINDKLISRHPHVFSDKKLKDTKDIVKHWIEAKAKKKGRKTLYERLPQNAPSLLLAHILFKEDRYLGDTFNEDEKIEKVITELKKIPCSRNKEETFVAILMEILILASRHKIDMECGLRDAIFRKAKKSCYPREKLL